MAPRVAACPVRRCHSARDCTCRISEPSGQISRCEALDVTTCMLGPGRRRSFRKLAEAVRRESRFLSSGSLSLAPDETTGDYLVVGASGHDVNSLSETGCRTRTPKRAPQEPQRRAERSVRSAYIFTRSSGWQQQVRGFGGCLFQRLALPPPTPPPPLPEAKLLANDTMAGDRFGVAVAVTEEGHVLVAGLG